MEKLPFTRESRNRATAKKLLVLHKNGSPGFILSNSYYDFAVKFPKWKGEDCPREYTYSDGSPNVTLYNIPYEQYITQGAQTMNALYEITNEDGSKTFATKVAEKSKTLWVMEIKGSNEFKAVETSRIQEVVPYTIKVKFLGEGSSTRHYEAEEGKFSVGDILLLASGEIVVVGELGTAVKGALELKARKRLVTADI